jgi:hypothetical protein
LRASRQGEQGKRGNYGGEDFCFHGLYFKSDGEPICWPAIQIISDYIAEEDI